MESMSERKHFRFPLVSDDEPVRLANETKRILFEGEPDTLLSGNIDTYVNKKANVSKTTESVKEETTQTRLKKENYTQEKEALKNKSQHAQQLPERRSREMSSAKRPEIKQTESSINRRSHRPIYQTTLNNEKKHQTFEKTTSVRKMSHQAPFRPKQLPESLMSEAKTNVWKSAELANQIKEEKKDYLLFDTVNPDFEEDKITNNDNDLNHRKASESDVTNQPMPKKKMRLEKSLSGIMDEEQSQLRANKYFNS